MINIFYCKEKLYFIKKNYSIFIIFSSQEDISVKNKTYLITGMLLFYLSYGIICIFGQTLNR
jgi:hypothetical protein